MDDNNYVTMNDTTVSNYTTTLTMDQLIKSFEAIKSYEHYSRKVFYSSPSTENILIAIYTFLSITGVTFNSLVTLRIITSATLRFFPYNILLVNFFVSNIMISIFCVPFTLTSLLRVTWDYGVILCKLIPAVQGIGVFVNAASITVAAIDRFIDVRNSRRQHVGVYYSTFRRLVVGSILIWTLGIMLGSPHAYFQEYDVIQVNLTMSEDKVVSSFDPTSFHVCSQKWNPKIRSIYSLAVFALIIILPTLTLLMTSIYIRKHSVNNQDNQIQVHLHANAIYDPSITRTLTIITLSFIIFWTPFIIFNVIIDLDLMEIKGLSGSNINLLYASSNMIAMTSLPLNAGIYSLLTASIRRELFFWRRRNHGNINMIELNVID